MQRFIISFRKLQHVFEEKDSLILNNIYIHIYTYIEVGRIYSKLADMYKLLDFYQLWVHSMIIHLCGITRT